MTLFWNLLRNDVRNVLRDRMLMSMSLLPIPFFIFLSWAIVQGQDMVDLTPYYSLIYAYAGIQLVVIFGFVMGMLFVDERDQDLFPLFTVLPVSSRALVFSRFCWGIGVTMVYALLMPMLIDVLPVGGGQQIIFAILLGMEVVLLSTALVVLARNKVEAMVAFKGLNIFLLLPLLIPFVPSWLGNMFWVSPTSWVLALSEHIAQGTVPYMTALVGIGVHVVLGGVLFWILGKKVL